MSSFRATISQASNRPRARRGFTLIELLVVMVIIALVTSSVLPSVIKIFTAGADAQAANLLAAQLAAARALAITEGTHAGVHVQKADPDATGMTDAWFSAVMLYDKTTSQFALAPGFTPRRLPGSIVFGEFSPTHVNSATGDYIEVSGNNVERMFTNLTVVFSPTGSVVKQAMGQPVTFRFDPTDGNDAIFGGGVPTPRPLWDPDIANWPSNTGEPAATAVILFDYSEFRKLADNDNARSSFLKVRGQLFPINVYTGQLFAR